MIFRTRRTRPSPNTVLLLLLLFLLASAGSRIYEGYDILALNRTGVHVQAKLSELETGDSDDNRVQLEYTWPVPQGSTANTSRKFYSDLYRLPPALAQSLHTGQRIEIVYAPRRPGHAIPVLATQCAFHGVGWFIFFSILVFLLLLLRLWSSRARASNTFPSSFFRSR